MDKEEHVERVEGEAGSGEVDDPLSTIAGDTCALTGDD